MPVRRTWRWLALLSLLWGAAGAALPGPAVCVDARDPAQAASPLTPLDTWMDGQDVGVLLARLDGEQVLIRPEDLPLLNLPDGCPAGTLMVLPAQLHPQVDLSRLTLQLASSGTDRTGMDGAVLTSGPATERNAPQTTGTLLGGTLALNAGAGTVSGSAQLTTDTRLRPPGTPGEPAWGVRSASLFAVTWTAGQAQWQAQAPSAYLYRQQGDTELQVGLLTTDGPLTAAPLLGVAIRNGLTLQRPAPLRLTSARAGRYRVTYAGVTLAQGILNAGVTDLPDFTYPPVQGTLTVELSAPDGTVERRIDVPFDQRPQQQTPGQLTYTVTAGRQPDGYTLRARTGYSVSDTLALTGDATLGPAPGAHFGVRWQPTPTQAYGADALAQTGTVNGAPLQKLAVSAATARAEPWGSWTMTAQATQEGTATGTDRTLSLQASAYITGPNLQLTASAEQQQGQHPQQTLRLGASGLLPRHAGTWSAQGYTQTRRDPDGPHHAAGIAVQLDLTVSPGLSLQGGVTDGHAQLTARQQRTLGEWTLDDTLQLWPTPALTLNASGPVNASLRLEGGPGPQVAAAVTGTLAFAGGQVQALPTSTQQVLEVRVGLPGVTVTSGTAHAVTGTDGRALLPAPPFGWAAHVTVDLDTLPLSATLDRNERTVQPAPDALVTVADFTTDLQRSDLRQLPAHVPVGADAQLGEQHFTVPDSHYIQLNARNGDPITVTWPGGRCEAVWSDNEQLSCEPH